jgi:hypothetical protein
MAAVSGGGATSEKRQLRTGEVMKTRHPDLCSFVRIHLIDMHLDRNQIGQSWHSARHYGLWNMLCAWQNRDAEPKGKVAKIWQSKASAIRGICAKDLS